MTLIRPDAKAGGGARHAAIGYWLPHDKTMLRVDQGTRAVLAQEIRNARGGQFTFTVRAWGVAQSRSQFDDLFRQHFTARLVLFRFAIVLSAEPERHGAWIRIDDVSLDFNPRPRDDSVVT